MSVQSDHHSVVREPKSPINRYAIDAAVQLLATGVWFECQLRSTARRGAALIERPSWSEPAGRLLQVCVSTINHPRNEEP